MQGGTASLVTSLCRLLDFVDVGGSALVPTPGGVNIGPVDSRMQQTPFMKGTLWGCECSSPLDYCQVWVVRHTLDEAF